MNQLKDKHTCLLQLPEEKEGEPTRPEIIQENETCSMRAPLKRRVQFGDATQPCVELSKNIM